MAAGPPASNTGNVIEKATATLPQSTAGAIFTITRGRIRVLSLIGEVTTVIQTQACNMKLTANPTTGTSVDLCSIVDVSADEAGALYSITGTFTDPIQGGVAGTVCDFVCPFIVNIGSIDLDCSASNTGNIKWRLEYEELDSTTRVVAA